MSSLLGRSVALGAALAVAGAAPLSGQNAQDALPSSVRLGELSGERCSGEVVTSIDLDRRTVFEPDSTGFAPLAWAYRTLNLLHVRTRPSFIRDELLFDVGDCYDEFLVGESERLLDNYGFLESARITSEPDGDGSRRVVVQTRDDWSTQVDAGITYESGLNLEKLTVREDNFLGRGLFARYERREWRELSAQSVVLATPRFFGRADASVQIGRDRPGTFFHEYLRYPFVGETGRYSARQGYDRGTTYFAYGTDPDRGGAQVFVPEFREVIELSLARRFGPPGRSMIAGVTLSRDVTRFGELRTPVAGDLDDLVPLPGPPPENLTGQLGESSSTRLWLHVGTRRFRYEDYEGLDALRDRLLVGLGYYVGFSVGKGLPILGPADVPGADDVFGRVNGAFTIPIGSSLLHGGASAETRVMEGAWRDLLSGAELVAYLRNVDVPGHLIFLRSSFAGGWRATIPFQLALGGRETIRSLPEDAYPGGRMVRFVAEDRIVFPWPRSTIDLGMSVFTDLGRVWPGDAPYGVDSGWQSAAGFGLRVGLPARTRYAWRLDLAFPVGRTSGPPVFRISLELNRLAIGFTNPDLRRSTRFGLGAQHF